MLAAASNGVSSTLVSSGFDSGSFSVSVLAVFFFVILSLVGSCQLSALCLQLPVASGPAFLLIPDP
jgi:hypothetical protein